MGVSYLLLTTTTHCSPLTSHNSLFTAHDSLFTTRTYYLLLEQHGVAVKSELYGRTSAFRLVLLSAETSLTTAAPAATETLFGASTSAASASTSAASTSAATASPSGGECRACRGRHEAHTCSRRGTPHGAGTGRDGKGTTSATSATSAGTATTSLAVMQSPDGKGVQRDRTPTNTARDRREILSELIKREGALPAVVMRGFLQSEMRGDGGMGASASGGGAGQHDGERRGKAVQIDYRTVVRIIGEMEKDGEVRTLEADHPTQKDRDEPARPATMQAEAAL